MRLRQLVTVASDLRSTERAITQALDVEVCYRDPGVGHFGLRHGLYTIGDRLLEVVVPKQDGTTAGRFLERRGGDGGYMVIVQVDDLAAHKARLAETDIRIVFEAGAPGMQGLHLHPADVGGAILSIDQADPPESWAWAGPDFAYHANSSVASDLVGAEPVFARWFEENVLEARREDLVMWRQERRQRSEHDNDNEVDGSGNGDLVLNEPSPHALACRHCHVSHAPLG